jgi:murein DD-endopeptidase MepM/ murein hydrolase activator NlpD
MFLGREPKATALQFTGGEGQVLRLELARPEPIAARRVQHGKVDIDLYLVDPGSKEQVRPLPLEQHATAEAAYELTYRLPVRGRYLVSVRPEPSTDALYHLTLELDAALTFPVAGRREGVSSFFGAPRDAGTRHHEGVDIFAARMTPVVAVADGRATPRENHLGGHTVWLSTPGLSYYYAHLERATVAAGQHVRRGDVLGYVGNTGNAITTGPHLHFGVYRWGRGAVDPMPLLEARRFAVEDGDEPRIEPGATQKYLRALCAPGIPTGEAVDRGCGRSPSLDLVAAERTRSSVLPDIAITEPARRRVLPPEFVATGAVLEVAREEETRSILCEVLPTGGRRCPVDAKRAMAF